MPNKYFFFENRAFYKILSKNIVQPDKATGDNTWSAHCMLDT